MNVITRMLQKWRTKTHTWNIIYKRKCERHLTGLTNFNKVGEKPTLHSTSNVFVPLCRHSYVTLKKLKEKIF